MFPSIRLSPRPFFQTIWLSRFGLIHFSAALAAWDADDKNKHVDSDQHPVFSSGGPGL